MSLHAVLVGRDAESVFLAPIPDSVAIHGAHLEAVDFMGGRLFLIDKEVTADQVWASEPVAHRSPGSQPQVALRRELT